MEDGWIRAQPTRLWHGAGMASLGADLEADRVFACPRCGGEVAERFYGPCASCRHELRATQRSAGGTFEADLYEPKMNVTPNAVALKE